MADDVKISTAESFDVDGVLLPRPFAIRHFGLDIDDIEACRDFYERMMGLRVADPLDFGGRLPDDEKSSHGPSSGYFMRHGTDHHAP
jgi:catechol 2,3-dioxygenase-like lactoylglutathione lyase family enzyme